MHRGLLTFAVLAVSAGPLAGTALASQCPKLIGEINAATATRFDPAAAGAKQKAAEAAQLHASGKHAESEKAARDGLSLLGIQK